jgi:hypothetical protein
LRQYLTNPSTAHDQHLIKSLWPDNIGHLSAELVDLNDCWGWQAVPENFEDLCDWAYLAKNKYATDKKHCHHLLYAVP